MSKVALGFVETRGNTGCVVAIDAMLKTAYRRGVILSGLSAGGMCWFEWGHSDSMSFYVTAIVRGEVGAVKSSVEAGAEAAAKVAELICANVIPSAHEDVFELIGIKK